MKLIRVFPRRTSHTPKDELVFIGDPPLFLPEADEVHISCAFTWDIERAKRLVAAWAQYYPAVKVGGPAFDSPIGEFMPGRYIRQGITFTTFGCNNQCPWCLVHKREGKLVINRFYPAGYIIQDNNVLQAGRVHFDTVIDMLGKQRHGAIFSGGLEADLISDEIAERLQSIVITDLFLAADTIGSLRPLRKAADKLKVLGRHKLRCYVLLAFGSETIEQAMMRLETVWEAGCTPFAQLYQPPDRWIDYPKEWHDLARTWSRPAAMAALHKGKKGGVNDKD